MKTEEIIALSGRELDAAVAELVFGWSDMRIVKPTGRPKSDWMHTGLTPDGGREFVDEFSLNWHAMSAVLAWLKGHGWVVVMHDHSGRDCLAALYLPHHSRASYRASGETLPAAVCRVALLAARKVGQ